MSKLRDIISRAKPANPADDVNFAAVAFIGPIAGHAPAARLRPALPAHQGAAPAIGELWLHEIKHDGFRVIARKEGDRVRLYSRPGNSEFAAASKLSPWCPFFAARRPSGEVTAGSARRRGFREVTDRPDPRVLWT